MNDKLWTSLYAPPPTVSPKTASLEINPLTLGSPGSTVINETGASVYRVGTFILCVLKCLRYTNPLFQMLVFKI